VATPDGASGAPLFLGRNRGHARARLGISAIPVYTASTQLPEDHLIARVWHGYTQPEHADAYEAMLKPELLPGISNVKGYRGSYLLRRAAGEEVEFITVMLWDSIDSIRAVSGPDYETAVIPQERRQYLSHYDAKAAHYEIAATHGLPV
jgi:heme-degrading monooxygenase HmoA